MANNASGPGFMESFEAICYENLGILSDSPNENYRYQVVQTTRAKRCSLNGIWFAIVCPSLCKRQIVEQTCPLHLARSIENSVAQLSKERLQTLQSSRTYFVTFVANFTV